jgi:hypothetical protein
VSPPRDPGAVLREAVGYLALLATRRHYDEQPDLWSLGEHGRARTLEDYQHHFRHLAALDARVWDRHLRYCDDLFTQRGFPKRWLHDAWRIMTEVLEAEMPPEVRAPALELLRRADAGAHPPAG